MRGRFLALAGAVALAVSLPASAARTSVKHFTVVSAKAAATLTFRTTNSEGGSTQGTARLTLAKKRTGSARVPGAARVPLSGALKESVSTKTADSPGSPYQETCANTRKTAGKGGFVFRKSGAKIEARWAFPQAKFSFCRGPKLGKSITAKIKRVYSSATFDKPRVTVVLKGKSTSRSGDTTLTYRWNAKVTLARS